MNLPSRLLGLSVLLLLGAVGVALVTQGWLQQQTRRIRTESIAEKRRQLEAALETFPRPDLPANADQRVTIEELLGAQLGFHPGPPAADSIPNDPGALDLTLETALPAAGGAVSARMTFPLPATSRLILVNQRLIVVLVLAIPAVLIVLAVAFIFGSSTRGGGTAAPWAEAAAEMSSLQHLAQASVARGEALDRERVGRRRAEDDARLSHSLLTRSLEERIRLGRDLHDGIIQSLYAVGLTLESVRSLAASDPEEADRQLSQCLERLNGTIREVRRYILGLSPESLQHGNFLEALQSVVSELGGGTGVEIDLRVDADAADLLTPEQAADLVQIAREAVSNSVRHGHARNVTLRLHRSDREVGLLIQDDGTGFDPSAASSGHGLANMQARASTDSGSVRIESERGKGSRILVTIPILTAP